MEPGLFRTLEVSDPRFEHEGLRHITVKSAGLHARGDLLLWVPPAEHGGELPLALLLHGVYGSAWSWALSGGVHRTAARLLAAGEIPPFAIAMPSDGLWGDGSAYLRHPPGQDFEQWIVHDVALAARMAEARLAREGRCAIGGLSMGGFGALRLGAKYHEQFCAISGHSSITEFRELEGFVEESLALYGLAALSETALGAILGAGKKLPPLRFDCGTEDPLIEGNRRLHAALTEHGVAHEYVEYPGGHEWPYWEEHVAETLRWFGRGWRSV